MSKYNSDFTNPFYRKDLEITQRIIIPVTNPQSIRFDPFPLLFLSLAIPANPGVSSCREHYDALSVMTGLRENAWLMVFHISVNVRLVTIFKMPEFMMNDCNAGVTSPAVGGFSFLQCTSCILYIDTLFQVLARSLLSIRKWNPSAREHHGHCGSTQGPYQFSGRPQSTPWEGRLVVVCCACHSQLSNVQWLNIICE